MQKMTFSSLSSRATVNLKILQADWPRAFWPITQEPDFSQVWDVCKNTAVNINFIVDQIHKKLITKFSNKFKKPYFWPILKAKKVFPKI